MKCNEMPEMGWLVGQTGGTASILIVHTDAVVGRPRPSNTPILQERIPCRT